MKYSTRAAWCLCLGLGASGCGLLVDPTLGVDLPPVDVQPDRSVDAVSEASTDVAPGDARGDGGEDRDGSIVFDVFDAGDARDAAGDAFDAGDGRDAAGDAFDAGDVRDAAGDAFDAGDVRDAASDAFDAGDAFDASDAGDAGSTRDTGVDGGQPCSVFGRALLPWSGATVSRRDVRFRVQLPSGATGSIEFSSTRDFASPMRSGALITGAAGPVEVVRTLPMGSVLFWRLAPSVMRPECALPVYALRVGSGATADGTEARAYGVATDFGGDGQSELALAVNAHHESAEPTENGGRILLLRFPRGGDLTQPPMLRRLRVDARCRRVDAQPFHGDFNGDGRIELAYTCATEGARLLVPVVLGAGALSNGEAVALPTMGDTVMGVAPGDLDGDGYSDVAMLSRLGGASQALLVLGFGSPTGLRAFAALTLEGVRNVLGFVAPGDLDGNGRADLVAATGDLVGAVLVRHLVVERIAGQSPTLAVRPVTLTLGALSDFRALFAVGDPSLGGRPGFGVWSRTTGRDSVSFVQQSAVSQLAYTTFHTQVFGGANNVAAVHPVGAVVSGPDRVGYAFGEEDLGFRYAGCTGLVPGSCVGFSTVSPAIDRYVNAGDLSGDGLDDVVMLQTNNNSGTCGANAGRQIVLLQPRPFALRTECVPNVDSAYFAEQW